MKVVILAGGFGTRISEESAFKPKPMIEIGGMPILWHIMKTYSAYGYNEFVICAGYKQHVIKEWFADYFLHTSDITFDYTHGTNEMIVHNKHAEPWRVTVVDTGLNTQTGGRVKRIREYIGNEPFMLTYGDAVGDVNIAELVAFHQAHGKIGTMSMYNFGQNKGVVEVGANSVIDAFREKSDMDGDLINIGFMVFQPELFDLIEGDETVFEKGPLTKLVAQKQLVGYIHQGFWQCMDTLREKQKLEQLWASGNAPWKVFDLSFYQGKKVFVTGHTGFKGSWLCKVLANAGAIVTGYSLNPPTSPSLFEIADIAQDVHSVIGDIRDYATLKAAFDAAQPEIVLHLAAQPIVRDSYKNPAYTYETNVMGTVNILECVRNSNCVKSFLNVTTDKVYLNKEWAWGYRENEELDGFDPYSNSKSCSELVTHSYKNSFFADGRVAISTARAGNVIGGGDFANDRIIPDCIRAAMKQEDIVVRNPFSTRPYQHVLEPLYAYLMIAAMQYEDGKYAGYYNVGPDDVDCFQTGALVDLFVRKWGEGMKWVNRYDGGPHEANFLKLDCAKLKTTFGWKPHWNLDTAIEKVAEWSKCYLSGGDVRACMDEEITAFLSAGE